MTLAVPPGDSFGFEADLEDTVRSEDRIASSPASFYASLPAPVNILDREFQSPIPDHGETKHIRITTYIDH